jgi:hypothetical protein
MKPSVFRTPSVLFVTLVLALETLAMAAIVGFLVFQLVSEVPDSLPTALGLIIAGVLALGWIAVTTVGFVRGRASSRGSAVVWQVLQAAVGIASNQGLFARPDLGSALLVPAVLVVALLLFSKNINAHLGVDES